MAGWHKACAPETKDRLQRPHVRGKSVASVVEEVAEERCPGPAGKLEGTNERVGQPGGRGRLCPHPDALRMKPASAGQRTDIAQSPSAAPEGESHSLQTSSGGTRCKSARNAISILCTVTLCV